MTDGKEEKRAAEERRLSFSSSSSAKEAQKRSSSSTGRQTTLQKSSSQSSTSKLFSADVLLGLTLSGVCAGVTVETLLYPLDTIKTRLQAARQKRKEVNKLLFKGVFNGLSRNIAGCVPATALFFLVYEPTKRYLERTLPKERSVGALLVAGTLGCLASSIVRVPTEVIKTRAQTGRGVQSVRGIIKQTGLGGLFVGYGSFLLRDLPFDAIEFSLYEEAKIHYAKLRRVETNSIGCVT